MPLQDRNPKRKAANDDEASNENTKKAKQDNNPKPPPATTSASYSSENPAVLTTDCAGCIEREFKEGRRYFTQIPFHKSGMEERVLLAYMLGAPLGSIMAECANLKRLESEAVGAIYSHLLFCVVFWHNESFINAETRGKLEEVTTREKFANKIIDKLDVGTAALSTPGQVDSEQGKYVRKELLKGRHFDSLVDELKTEGRIRDCGRNLLMHFHGQIYECYKKQPEHLKEVPKPSEMRQLAEKLHEPLWARS